MIGILDTAPTNVDILLVTRDRDLGQHTPYPGLSGHWINRSGVTVFYLNTRSARQWWLLLGSLRRDRFDLLYVNSVWEPVLSIIPVLAMVTRLVDITGLLVAPRGELSPGALKIRGVKKRIFLLLWRPLLKRLRPIWHASAESEALDIRATFSWAEIRVSLDQPVLPAVRPEPPVPHDGPINFVFISRISPMKNLLIAIEALAAVAGNANFDIYGPIEDVRYWRECQTAMGNLPANIIARYRGTLHPTEVVSTFAKYDAFIFPTRGESFGHVIAESLNAFCPVICSGQTYWTTIVRNDGGDILASLEPRELASVLDKWAAATPLERAAAGRAAGGAFDTWLAERGTGPNVLDLVRPDASGHR